MLINNKTIVKDSDARIRRKSVPVAIPLTDEDKQLLHDLYDYVRKSTIPEVAEKENLQPAVGISAIQVGIARQLTAVVVNDTDKNGQAVKYEYMLANPRIISRSVQKAYLEAGEGCLSVPEVHKGFVVRSARVKIKGFDLLQEKEITIRAHGYLAIVLQHELDHFDGTLFYDHIDPKNPFPLIPDAEVI